MNSTPLQKFETSYGFKPTVVAASPGRIEFIGNHTDYNGGDVLGAALNLKVEVAGARLDQRKVILRSDGIAEAVEVDLDKFGRQQGERSWANYPLGILTVLRRHGYEPSSGYAMQFSSDLPSGAGLSSSAAIELATLELICRLENWQLERIQKVLFAQEAENSFVGVPCGMLDQAVSCFGQPAHLVRIDCAATNVTTVGFPADWQFWIFNSNHKHSLVDSLYAVRHEECRKALTAIQQQFPDVVHLAHAPVEALAVLAEGSDLLKRARHVIEEQLRVKAMIGALEAGEFSTVGELLFASHASSRSLFENSIPELDTMVELLAGMQDQGVIGARLTGGGFGGAVMALTRPGFDPAPVVKNYQHLHPKAEKLSVFHVQAGQGTHSTIL